MYITSQGDQFDLYNICLIQYILKHDKQALLRSLCSKMDQSDRITRQQC